MFTDYQTINVFPTSSADVATNLIVALICGLILSVVYRITYKGPSYSVTFVSALILLSMISSIVIMVVGNNIARAFGLVGAMSIIRFRTAVRDTMDMVFIFLSLAIGMACGVGLNAVALTGSVITGLVILTLNFTHWGAPRRRHFLLQIVRDTSVAGSEADLSTRLSKYCRQLKLVSIRNVGAQDVSEMNYHITLRDVRKSGDLLKAIQELPGIQQVNVYFDEDDINSPTM
jgi:uncharacterized membrane protein YhiD involved in acid resistance